MSDLGVNNEQPPAPEGAGRRHRRGPWGPRFTEEELRVFEECKRESLIYRALPLATIFGVATFAAVKYGYLSPNAKFGPAPKVILASLLGYGIGKFSYRKTCMKKMMALPNSRFGQFLKERGGGCGPWGFRNAEEQLMFSAGAHPRDFYWGVPPLTADTTPAPEGLEAKSS